ncbi:aldo/keto reductase [Helicobacter jaachi]|uniref:Aldo/keto reductase n=1 Tax=Helicobacter jaachi TaxID=1677920 RepID=A0A4U8TC23_9HELI|nr:aldo/keto reductase [Helicobacter jaachi]TLD97500.1 aldo/keto reductase [Helicobacter jaachi]
MKTRKLGNLEVSSLGLGCMGLSYGYGKGLEKSEAIKLVQKAYDSGITLFDTAEAYGTLNEEIVGEALQSVRDKVTIATKFGIYMQNGTQVLDSKPERINKRLDSIEIKGDRYPPELAKRVGK